jgi:hypothetical protein
MYKNKYLKYKLKYLQLIKQFGGECTTPEQINDNDPLSFISLKEVEHEKRITLGIRHGNPGKCMLVISAFYHNILDMNPNILVVGLPITQQEKELIKSKFKELYFKIIRFQLSNGQFEMAVCINNFMMIPFNDYYQPILIPKNTFPVSDIQEYGIGCLVIIRRLKSFLDAPPPGIRAGITYNTKTMNNSLGVIVGHVDDRCSILILAKDTNIEQFREKHPDKLPSTEQEIIEYYNKYGKESGLYISKRQLISIKKENLELV